MTTGPKLTRKAFLSTIGRSALGLTAASLIGLPSSAQAAEPLAYRLVPAGELNPEMPKLLGIAIDSKDRIYAAGASGIKIFDRDRNIVKSIAASGPACAVAVDAEGMIYMAQRARIEKYSPDGTLVASWGELGVEPGQFRFITAIAAGERTIYVADSGARCIHRFSPEGDYAGEIAGPNDSKEEHFVIPSGFFDLALDAKGNLLAGHTGRHRVERYDPNGELTAHWGKYGAARENFCGCCNPTNLALFADGRVATTEKGVPRLKVHDSKGNLLACLGPESFPGNAAGMDLAIDSKGRIALVEPISETIRFYAIKKR